MRTSNWLVSVLAIVPIAIVACSSDESSSGGTPNACTPGVQQACACPGGGAGAQRCNAGGTAFEACICTGSGGPDGSTGVDSGVDSSIPPGDAAVDQFVEPSGPVLVGVVPVNGGGPVGMVVEGDTVIAAAAKRTTVGMVTTFTGSVVSMPAGGGGPVETLATGPLRDLASQTSNLVAATATDVFYVVDPAANNTYTIMKKSRASAAAATPFITNQQGVSYMQHDGGFLYWTASTGLRRSPVGAVADTPILAAATSEFHVVGANAYFGIFGGASSNIRRVAVTGGGATTIVADSLSGSLLSLTSDPAGSVLVYHDFSPASSVYRAPIGGAATGTLVIAATNDGTQTPRIATDGTNVFYVSFKVIKSVPIGGGNPVDLVTTHDPLLLTNAGTRIYWYNRNDNSVWRMKKP